MIKIDKKIVFIIIPILFILLFISGPKVKVNIKIEERMIPDDLDYYLSKKESSVPNLTPNTEKKIYWYNKDKSKTEYSIVYIHGFSASRQEIVPVCDIIANTIKANIFYTRLTAHGQGPEEFAKVTANDWLNDAYEAIEIGKRIGNKVILIGMSTGALLSICLAEQNQDIYTIIFLSPAFKLADKNAEILLLPWGNVVARLSIGKYREFIPKNKLHAHYWTTKYRVEGLLQLIALTDYFQKNIDVRNIKMPSIFIYTENDKVINIEYLKKVYNNFGAKNKKIVNIQEAQTHIITGDICSPLTTEKTVNIIIEFLNEIKI